MDAPLSIRRIDHRDMTLSEIHLRVDSLDVDARSVEAVVATDRPVEVFDLRRFERIDEILRADGLAATPDKVPLLNNHFRHDLADVLGSVREFRRLGGQWRARLFFAEGDEAADMAWNKVRQGHLDAVSVGYRVLESVEIPPGERHAVDGKTYRADERTLRVVTKWEVKEVSLVPIGADDKAKIRSQLLESSTMNPRLRAYLEHLAGRKFADDAEARRYQDGLQGTQRAIAALVDHEAEDAETRTAVDASIRALGVDPESFEKLAAPANTQAPKHPNTQPNPAAASHSSPTDNRLRDAATGTSLLTEERIGPALDSESDERDRVRRIYELAEDDVDAPLVRQAVVEGWSAERAAREFLTAVRGRSAAVPGDGATAGPAIHSRSRETDVTRETLAAAMLHRAGLDPMNDTVHYSSAGTFTPDRRADDERERAADVGYRYSDLSLMDVAREALAIDGVRVGPGRQAVLSALAERSFSSGSALTSIFTTNFASQLLASYMSAPDTTGRFTIEADASNFQLQERARLEKAGSLTKRPRGMPADHMAYDSNVESYKIAEYAGQFVVDQQDLIDDRFGGINQHTPTEMGEAAAQLRPDLVYAILLGNPDMRDGVALFHASHSNLRTTAGLAKATLEQAITDMATQTENGRVLNNFFRTLIVPEALRFTARELVRSATVVTGSDTIIPSANALVDENLEVVPEPRLDNGVTDPDTGAVHAGSSSTWFGAARGGRHTIEVGYLAGTGRRPQIRFHVLTEGRWGLAWDVQAFIGAKALDWRGLHKNTA